MTETQDNAELLTVEAVAERTGVSRFTVLRWIAAHELFAVRDGKGQKAPWRIPREDFEALVAARADEERMRDLRERGMVVGYGDDFLKQLKQSPNTPAVKAAVHAAYNASLTQEQVAELLNDETIAEQFEKLDEAEAIEAAAQRLAVQMRDERARVRRAERIYDRAREILADEDDGEQDARRTDG